MSHTMMMRTDFDIALIKVTKSFDDINTISHPLPPMDLNIKAEIPPMGSTVNGWLMIRLSIRGHSIIT